MRRLRITQDLNAPTLELQAVPELSKAGTWYVRGQTDSGAAVYINGQRSPHVNGLIKHAVTLRTGANLIIVESVDPVGNSTFKSLSVIAK